MNSDEFRKAVAGVKPLKRAKRIALKGPVPAPVPHQRESVRKSVENRGQSPISGIVANNKEIGL